MLVLAVLLGAVSTSFIPEKCHSINQNTVLVLPLLRSETVRLILISHFEMIIHSTL